MTPLSIFNPPLSSFLLPQVCNRTTNTPLSFEEAVRTGHVLLSSPGLSTRHVVGLLDECLACLVTWLEGHSLAQTVFTCLYLHHTDKVGNIIPLGEKLQFL